MSEQMTETPARESRAARAARLAAEQASQQGDTGTGTPDLAHLATLDPDSGDLTDEDRAAFAALTDKQREQVAELRQVAAVEGFTVAKDKEIKQATTPVRNRKPVQLAMDKVARRAYADWVEAGRPSTWLRMPVITYYISPDVEDGHGSAADYRKWIRSAVLAVTPEPFEKDGQTVEPSGVRARFGGDFVLTEKMANKIGQPDKAGYTVLSWAAIDKRRVAGNSADSDD
jgi:hypothetical protein